MDSGKVALIAILANIILAFFKIAVGLISKSSAVFSEGLHSATDVVSSGLSFIGITLGKKPADKEHPYGHYKFEVLAGLMITVILFLTGIWVLYEAYQSFLSPQLTQLNYLALGVMAFSAIINEIMARAKMYYGEKEQSLSLITDGVHSRVDVITSIAIFLGLFLTPIFIYSDSLLTLFIGIYIIKEAVSLGREATDSLLDKSADEKIEQKIKEIITQQKITLSNIMTQKKGAVITANIEIKLPPKLELKEATKISDKLREELLNKIDSLEYVAIQIKSHDTTTNYFKPKDIFSKIGFGKGFGWQRQGKFKEKFSEAKGKGPIGDCVCPKCGFKIKHERGVPCATIKCPKCNIPLTRGE